MKRRVLALCAGLLLLGLMPGSTLATVATSPPNLDQSNGPVGDCSARSSSDLAQTFTAGKSGSLSGVDLWMNGDGSATVTVSIEATTAGKPNGTVLATASATPPITAAWVHFSFSTPPSVTSGTMYAIVFNTGRNTNVCIAAIYAGAEGWAWDGAWYPYGDPPEFAFQTYVDAAAATPSPAPTAEPTATPSPSSSATPPPTGTGVGPASDDPGSTIWFLAVALVAFFGGLLVLVTRQRRRIW